MWFLGVFGDGVVLDNYTLGLDGCISFLHFEFLRVCTSKGIRFCQ